MSYEDCAQEAHAPPKKLLHFTDNGAKIARVVKLASKKRARAATLKYQVAVTVPLTRAIFAPLSVKRNSFF